MSSNTPMTIDGLDSCGFTALHFASYHGNNLMIDLLIDSGANIYATNK